MSRGCSRREHVGSVGSSGMDDDLEQLPVAYAAYLRLAAAGVEPRVIAEQLDVPVDALPLLAELARAKLAQLRSGASDAGQHPLA